jgi:hypothetical protein
MEVVYLKEGDIVDYYKGYFNDMGDNFRLITRDIKKAKKYSKKSNATRMMWKLRKETGKNWRISEINCTEE